MNKATKEGNAKKARLTMMVRDGKFYVHDVATVGHAKHTDACWTEAPQGEVMARLQVFPEWRK